MAQSIRGTPATNGGGLTVNSKNLPWLPLAPKVSIKILRLSPESGGFAVIVRAEEGGILPRHRHLESAEIFIIQGSGGHPQTGFFTEGDYISEEKGAVHDPLVFGNEVELLMISNGPSAFLSDDDEEVHMMDVPMLEQLAETAK